MFSGIRPRAVFRKCSLAGSSLRVNWQGRRIVRISRSHMLLCCHIGTSEQVVKSIVRRVGKSRGVESVDGLYGATRHKSHHTVISVIGTASHTFRQFIYSFPFHVSRQKGSFIPGLPILHRPDCGRTSLRMVFLLHGHQGTPSGLPDLLQGKKIQETGSSGRYQSSLNGSQRA